MYKKVLCLTLAMIIMCGMFVFSASAEISSALDDEVLHECREAYIIYQLENSATVDESLVYFKYLGEAGCHVFQAAPLPGSPVEPFDIIGNYRFNAHMCMSYCDTNPAGMYAYKDGELFTLREAYYKDMVDLDELYENTDKRYMMLLDEEELLKNKCRAEYMEEFGIEKEFEEEVYVGVAVKFDNYTVFAATVGPRPTLCVHQYIDGYWFYEGAICGDEKTNPVGLYTLDNYGNVQSLNETACDSFIDMDEIFPTLSEAGAMYMAGDIDGDKKLTVRDATLIQKYLAKYTDAMDTVNAHVLGYKVMDADLSGAFTEYYDFGADVNIKDATYIQKKVAKIITDSDRQPFEYGEILVFVSEDNEKVYTLEDFPEYEFESIKRGEYATYLYTLTLKNYGKDHVINAVNSLEYREGVDIEEVCANYLFYPD